MPRFERGQIVIHEPTGGVFRIHGMVGSAAVAATFGVVKPEPQYGCRDVTNGELLRWFPESDLSGPVFFSREVGQA